MERLILIGILLYFSGLSLYAFAYGYKLNRAADGDGLGLIIFGGVPALIFAILSAVKLLTL